MNLGFLTNSTSRLLYSPLDYIRKQIPQNVGKINVVKVDSQATSALINLKDSLQRTGSSFIQLRNWRWVVAMTAIVGLIAVTFVVALYSLKVLWEGRGFENFCTKPQSAPFSDITGTELNTILSNIRTSTNLPLYYSTYAEALQTINTLRCLPPGAFFFSYNETDQKFYFIVLNSFNNNFDNRFGNFDLKDIDLLIFLKVEIVLSNNKIIYKGLVTPYSDTKDFIEILDKKYPGVIKYPLETFKSISHGCTLTEVSSEEDTFKAIEWHTNNYKKYFEKENKSNEGFLKGGVYQIVAYTGPDSKMHPSWKMQCIRLEDEHLTVETYAIAWAPSKGCYTVDDLDNPKYRSADFASLAQSILGDPHHSLDSIRDLVKQAVPVFSIQNEDKSANIQNDYFKFNSNALIKDNCNSKNLNSTKIAQAQKILGFTKPMHISEAEESKTKLINVIEEEIKRIQDPDTKKKLEQNKMLIADVWNFYAQSVFWLDLHHPDKLYLSQS